MSITINDLKIYESEVMSNAANGGGGMTTNAIIDGASNNIFDDVSEPDRAYGKVNQRKMFMACKSPNNDKLFAALTYISKLPLDEKINVNLVKTQGYFDTVNARVIDTKASTVSSLHDAVVHDAVITTVTPAVSAVIDSPITVSLRKYNLDSASTSFPSGYHLNLVNSSFDAFLSGTQTSDATTLKIFGFDGCVDEGVYGTDGLILFFTNKFYLRNVLTSDSEFVTVTTVEITSYIDPDAALASSPDYLIYENGGSVGSFPPKKKYFATLTLSSALLHTYSGASPTDKTTWISSMDSTNFFPVKNGSAGIPAVTSTDPSYTTPAYTTYSTITSKQLYTAKKITSAISNNATSITVANNSNVVIPTVDGIILSDSILGISTAEFADDGYIDKEMIGRYATGVTIQLPEIDLISIKVEYKFDGVWSLLTSPTHYSKDEKLGTLVITTSLVVQSLTAGKDIRITYRVKQPRKAFLSGDIVAIINDKETVGTYSAAQTVTLTRTNLAKISVRDSANNLISESKFATDLAAGTITFVDVVGLSQPLTIIDRIEDFGLVQSVTGNVLSLYKPVTHDFPILNTVVSNCMYHGDLQATASTPFDQQTWTNAWSDTLIGSSTTAQFNQIDYPIVVSNRDTPTDRWILLFKTATTFDVIGEHLGAIATNQSISVNLAPINPHTAQPYFTIVANGFGGGWSAGNVIRFNTYSASAPFWCVQTIAQGTATDPDFNFAIEVRGDIDAL